MSDEMPPTTVPPCPAPEARRAADLYRALAAQFEHTRTDRRGGYTFEYLTGGQVTTRLLQVLGIDGWEFEIVEHGYHADADELWVRGRLTIHGPRRTVVREQFGSQKVNRRQGGGAILDIGFDLKGAATDALKKCATLVGLGLYLASPEEDARAITSPGLAQPAAVPPPIPSPPRPTNGTMPAPAAVPSVGQSPGGTLEGIDPDVAALLHRGYRAPTTAEKQALYIWCSRTLGYERAAVYEVLGLDPKQQHLEDWLQPADTTVHYLTRLLKLQVETGCLIPRAADFAPVA